MKKWICIFLCLVLTMGMSGCGRKESPVEDFEYEMVDGEVVITGYTGTDLEIYIPSKINDRLVIEIGKDAFAGYDMTLVDIPDTVEVIRNNAFAECKCLTEVKLSKNLKEIEKFAFYSCALTEVQLPDSLEKLGWGVFYSTELAELKIPFNTKFYVYDDDCESPVAPQVMLLVEEGSEILKLLQEFRPENVKYSIVGGSNKSEQNVQTVTGVGEEIWDEELGIWRTIE